MLFDIADCPDDLHRLMAFLRDGCSAKLDYLSANGLLSLNNDGARVGSGGFGWIDELLEADVVDQILAPLGVSWLAWRSSAPDSASDRPAKLN